MERARTSKNCKLARFCLGCWVLWVIPSMYQLGKSCEVIEEVGHPWIDAGRCRSLSVFRTTGATFHMFIVVSGVISSSICVAIFWYLAYWQADQCHQMVCSTDMLIVSMYWLFFKLGISKTDQLGLGVRVYLFWVPSSEAYLDPNFFQYGPS